MRKENHLKHPSIQKIDSRTYVSLLADLKTRINAAQSRAAVSVNRQMIGLYWEIGRMISARQSTEGWGSKVIDRLAADLKNELPEIKGFSARNMKRMKAFYTEYPLMPQTAAPTQPPENTGKEKVPRAVAQLGEASLDLPWGHNILLIESVKDLGHRLWYMGQTIEQGWSRDVLRLQIKSRAHDRQGGTKGLALTVDR